MTTSTIAILIAVVAVVLVLIALATGYYLNKRRQVSLKDETVEPKSLDKSGGYKAGGGFSFSEGTHEKEPVPATSKVEPKPKVEAAPVAPEAASAEPAAPAEPEPEITLADLAETEEQRLAEEKQAQEDARRTFAEEIAPDIATVAPQAPTEIEELENERAEHGERPLTQLDEIAPTEGRLDRLKGRLARSQSTVGASLLGLLGAGDLDEDSWEEIEDTLLMADLGTPTTLKVVEELREQVATHGVANAAEARALLRKVLIAEAHPEYDRSIKALPHAGAPSVLLVVGVNGTGKTTTTGKLARVLVADGRRVLLGAADTFRAAAADQLQTWAERVGADVVRGKEGADPAAVAFDAVAKGTEEGVDVVLIDTAGRLHTKTGLMDELDKVKRVVEKKAKVDEVLLVLDATIGQNGLSQAKVFAEVVDITGVVLTKLDGTAKGGIVYAVQHELGVPVKLVGLGEGADDLAPFEPGAFVDALLG
ncbi:Signal recognition particle receptor FtsY OS=Tsukamurella paurometabola (strain ATCC 8368 / DSM/ CCUG 35730 / CIP 100753 / JCM 10117 / KCTC 9821 / NBRC 16120 / NCIMB 702349 / NCTC 13040) OX=521096 GN=ftsY PE=3 SV=1 [Tsukamurella paurometabola]|uniref:Signal recognition particle receptor FtsY n=1 Tax=Tsukamurella paurometabola (strain ATCC 8368 / DSM 20162 / CCUG 35730 / CIP 100753 / JCM 10117 / KCTC 9821 / NBRC 16120 / NCIMB 702349 / NCTC 13040) TaxID=521096 RepID=D5UYC1_TSUPD|nr:signal recognition particle-docking protein FtsY [Tsukamurella paurometabola]ADG78228.1 signal recognition particle-docking protein FtsY [Tsukamurella paurometabola DSM 20162]SUP30769.1 Cell division protein FtsY homolog [Tsukamurella paurometabola]